MSLNIITAAIHNHLDGLNIGRGVKPREGGWKAQPAQSEFVPYGILWRIGSKDQSSLTVEDRNEFWRPTFFVRVFGPDAATTDEFMDRVRTQMLSVPLRIPGMTVHRVVLDNSQTTTRNDTADIQAYEAGDFYTVRLT